MADLDHFKAVNDTYGHMAGDMVLSIVARRMLSVVRSFDSIGRYGGEEFMVVPPGCDENAAPPLAERLRASVSGNLIDTPEGMIPVTVSPGVTASRGRAMADMEAVVQAADKALYRAKINGRDRVETSPVCL